LEYRRKNPVVVASNPAEPKGLYDYLVLNYINATKERLLNSTFSSASGSKKGVVDEYSREDLTKEDLRNR